MAFYVQQTIMRLFTWSAFVGSWDYKTRSSTVNNSPSERMSFITDNLCFTDVHIYRLPSEQDYSFMDGLWRSICHRCLFFTDIHLEACFKLQVVAVVLYIEILYNFIQFIVYKCVIMIKSVTTINLNRPAIFFWIARSDLRGLVCF